MAAFIAELMIQRFTPFWRINANSHDTCQPCKSSINAPFFCPDLDFRRGEELLIGL
jgi:hypothetical protein